MSKELSDEDQEMRKPTPAREAAARKLYAEFAVDAGNTHNPAVNPKTGKAGGSPWTGKGWAELNTDEKGVWYRLAVVRGLAA